MIDNEGGGKGGTWRAMTSGSEVVTKLVNSGQLLAFQVMNFNGSFFEDPSFSSSSSCVGTKREGFFEEPSFCTG